MKYFKIIFLHRPTFDVAESQSENVKNNQASTLQIATRTQVFILDVKFLIETISEDNLNRFGQLLLFNDKLIKLGNKKNKNKFEFMALKRNVFVKGYSFLQDSRKLSISFPSFRHRFSEFEESVINIDEKVYEVKILKFICFIIFKYKIKLF